MTFVDLDGHRVTLEAIYLDGAIELRLTVGLEPAPRWTHRVDTGPGGAAVDFATTTIDGHAYTLASLNHEITT